MWRPRRTLAALAVSGLLHGGLALWLVSRPPRTALEPSASVIELEWVEAPPLPPPPVPREPEAPTSPGPSTRVRKQRPSLPRAAAPEQVPLAAPLADAPFIERLPADAPRAQTFIPVPSTNLPLSMPVLPEERPTLQAPPIPEDLLGEATRATLGRAKVERGWVHPYYAALGKQLIKSWDADRAVSRKGLKGFAEQFAENSKAWNSIWLEHAGAFGASGTPLTGQSRQDEPRRAPAPSDRLNPNLDARRELRGQMRQEFRATRRATLRVVQDRKGALLSVELVSPSNDAHVDREAVADIRKAAQRLPAPPAEASAGQERLVSLWLFELIISITPPIPTFSFEFDEALGFIDARLPLDRRIYKRVKLLSVE